MGNKSDILPAPVTTKTQIRHHATSVIFAVVAFYWVASLSVVFLNKYILSSSEFKFAYPLFVTWYQLIVALVLLVTWGHLGKRYTFFSAIPPFEFNQKIAKRVAPLTIIYVMMLALNNLCLKYVEVTFYQIARSLSIFFNIVFTYSLLGQRTSMPAMVGCAIVFVGFVVGSYGEVNFSWAGIFYGVSSSAFVALYGIYVKKTLGIVENNQWKLLHYNTAISIVLISPIVVFSGELSEIYQEVYYLGDLSFWLLMTVTGVTGFLINTAMFLQIKYTTPLTNTISGTAKACVQTLLAAMFFQNPIPFMNGIGIFMSLFGSGYYSFVRYGEMKK
ncbi:hypothetical protein K493DRAFT_268866 [Basidiobolus meristosporus CBS 931.73]|uniref:Sugar phosphate transporter domain-containing protein n=1 Tax=Basidiobolus meristosporus CBS 931.73 TaxID=1314790 RepID=A0A1Y1XM00_9FUNG|nr:hypothetical protein K493DRAFT_268866 [Basidiobolus meristosporus CBS 931.73]|eukprot:ORX86790.1 hypothetical protein K493DRAFT_268866 [Basidiobolus meristosporus CBS 931.73]